ncbi:MAG: YhcN/YlaJ family sporulation lipoprotein [Clostridia bacterium]
MKIKIVKIFVFIVVLVMVTAGVACQRTQRSTPNRQSAPLNPDTTNGMTNPGASGTDLGRLGTPNDFSRLSSDENVNLPGTPNYNGVPLDNRSNLTGDQGYNNNNNVTDANRKAQDIANQLTAMDPIENATVVISGKTALVGIDVKDNYDNYDKDKLADKIKNMEPGVNNVVITESPDMYERVSNLSRDMRNGRVMQGLNDEFTKLVNRIRPTIR